ncbi:MAG: ribosome assembly factor SBDS [Candidatus Woesearchaeota archaeon]
MAGFGFDREKLHINVARLEKAGNKFEIVVDPDLAVQYKKGVDIKEILKSEHIFSDAHKGMVASEHLMEQVLGTKDPLEAAKIILEKGQVQLTSEHRERMREEKRKRIIDMIQRNGVDPKTHLPHPANRIENAFKEAGIKIDENRTAEDQIQEVLKELRPILPIKFEVKEISVVIPPEYAAKSYSIVKSFGTLLKEDWMANGAWSVLLELPGGLETDFYDKINSLTHGNVETKVLKTK